MADALYVHEAVYRPILTALAEQARRVKVGAAFEPGVELGPINNRPQFERVAELVDDARRQGGDVAAGGEPLPRPGYSIPRRSSATSARACGWSTRSSVRSTRAPHGPPGVVDLPRRAA